ncbi:hypothetical protein Emag_007142 [Eimeria magna]
MFASKCPSCRAAGFCPSSCLRRQYFVRRTRFPDLEVDRFGHSHYIRTGLPSPACFHPGHLRAVLAHGRPSPQAPPQQSVPLLQHQLGAADAAPSAPATEGRTRRRRRPQTPAAQRAVFCAAPPATTPQAAPPTMCSHTRLGTPRRAPSTATHTRAWATIDGANTLLSAPGPGARQCVTGVKNHTLHLLGRVSLEVRIGRLKITAPFFDVPGVALAALLGVDLLYEHETFEGQGGKVSPLLCPHPRLAPLRALAHDVAMGPGNTLWVRTTQPTPAPAPAPPRVYPVAPSTLPRGGLAIPEHPTPGLIAVSGRSDRPLHLSSGWPLAKTVQLPPAAGHSLRLVAANPPPARADGAAEVPAHEKAPGGSIRTLASPNRCLVPAEFQQLGDLLHEFQDCFNDGSETRPATFPLRARLDAGDAQPISMPPPRPSLAMRPAIFQRMVDLLLGGTRWVLTVGDIDDITALRAANLQLHPGKCSFGAAPVRYLEDIVSRKSTRQCPSEVEVILEMRIPKTAKAFWRSLEKCQYYRTPISQISITAAPLFHAATRQKNFTWTPAADTAWLELCTALSSEPVLAHPEYTRPFCLDCDGSRDGVGAVLLQPYDEGECIVAYASRSLLDHERELTATELEAAALILALETFLHYIDIVKVWICTVTRFSCAEARRAEQVVKACLRVCSRSAVRVGSPALLASGYVVLGCVRACYGFGVLC